MAALDAVADRDLQQRMARVEGLVGELHRLPDQDARAAAEEVVAAVLELHGAALARILDLVGDATVLTRLAAEPLVREVLLLHGLHPLDLRTRVEQALESVRPFMQSHGGGVTLAAVDGDVVRLRLEGHCQGCPSSTMTLKLAVEKAIWAAAPDVSAIDVDDATGTAPAGPPKFEVCPLPLASVAR